MKPARRATQGDVARLAGVSKATVSYVASGRSDRGSPASEATIEKVRQAMAALDYRPQFSGRALRRRRTGLLGVVTYSPLNPWSEVLLTQIQDLALRRGTDTALLRYARPAHADRLIKLLREGIADGVVVLGFGALVPRQQQALTDLPLPLLVVANDGPPGASYLRQHEPAAIVQAIERLRSRGVSRLHYIKDASRIFRPDTEREGWVAAAVDRAWPELSPIPVHHLDAINATQQSTDEVIDRIGPGPGTGVICASDRAAIAVLWAAQRRGIPIPGELRIIGMGNIGEGQISHPPLTSLGIRDADYCAAINHLLDRMDNPGIKARSFDHPWSLIPRGSD